MFKKIYISCMIILTCLMVSTIFAIGAPASIEAYDAGNNSKVLLDVKNPETIESTTTQKQYVLSGVGYEGETIATYYYDSVAGNYKLIYVDGAAAEQTIGASGLYAQMIVLNEGNNKLLIRAQAADGSYQIIKIEINLLVESFWDKIKRMPLDIGSLFK